MQNIRFSPFSRMTAVGVVVSLCALTTAPVVHAQSGSSPASPATGSAPVAAPKPAATPATPQTSEAKPAPPDKKTRDAARKAYTQGEKAFAAGDYATAQTAFAEANQLIASPHAQYWMAKSLDQQSKFAEAVAAYESFIASPDASRAGEDKIIEARGRVIELKQQLVAHVEVITTPAGAVVSVDGKPQPGTTPLTLQLPPGPHRLTLSATGYETREVELEAKPGEKLEQRLELAAVPPPAPPVAEPPPLPAPVLPPPAPEKRSMTPAFITLAIGAAGSGLRSFVGIMALSAKSDYDDRPSASAADDTERNALISDMAFGVAITLGVTGIVLLTSSDPGPRENTSARRQPLKVELDGYAGRTGGGASARLRF
ncbi:MAG TPA: PEGA domain-containing protein [Polyangiaceae bacterium]|nr:PEGA domain-containing protein [Polyangiaceae bacterium]